MIGDIHPCDVLLGEEVDGSAAGLDPNIRLRGVGLVPMREVYRPDQLTDVCTPHDTCWAAIEVE